MGAMRRMTSPFWKMRTVPVDWLTTTATAVVTLVMAAAAQWRVPRPLGRVKPAMGASMIRQAASTVPSRETTNAPSSCAISLMASRTLAVPDVAVLAAIPLERVEPQGARAGEDVARIADDHQRPDRLALAAFAADLDGDVDDGLEGFEGDAGFEGAEVSGSEALQVFSEADDGDGVEGFGLEAGINHHDAGAGLELVVGDGLDQGEGDPFGNGRIAGLDLDTDQTGLDGGFAVLVDGGGDEDADLARQGAHGGPVHRPLGDEQNRRRP